MIFDCFTFSEELDVLEIRLRLLEDVVDYFVLAEAPFTFRGKPKRLAYAESGERFARWRAKIIPLVYPEEAASDPWQNEWRQRDFLAEGLRALAGPEDLIILSDCDEIPDPANVGRRPEVKPIVGHRQRISHGFINRIHESPWIGTRSLLRGTLESCGTLSEVRKRPESELEIVDGGWHLSSFGGVDAVQKKMRTYSHSEFDLPYFTDGRRIEVKFRSEREGRWVPLDDTFPALFRDDPRWLQYVWDRSRIVDENLATALEHAHGCFAYVPQDVSTLAVAREDADAWSSAGRERFGSRFVGVFPNVPSAAEHLEPSAWVVVDGLERESEGAFELLKSARCGVVGYVRNARSYQTFERVLGGESFPPGPAFGIREFRELLARHAWSPERSDRIQTGGVFVYFPNLPVMLYGVSLGNTLTLDRISAEDLSDFIAHGTIMTWPAKGPVR